MLALLALIAVSAAVFFGIIRMGLPALWAFGLVVLEMVIVSQLLIRRFGMEGQMGLILLRSKAGLDFIDRLARNEGIFRFFADAGAFMSYGLLSMVLMRKNVSLKSAIAGIVLLTLLTLFVAPNVLPFLRDVLQVSVVEKTQAQMSGVDPKVALPVTTFILYFGGLFLILVLSLILYGVIVFAALVSTVAHGTTAMQDTAAGGTFLLPGVNLPFLEGVLALVVIMAVHEGAHAVLARIGKVRVVSSGIVLFGILPIGAFVDPDEKELEKLDGVKQTRVLVAGSSANLVTAVVSFVLFLILLFSVNAFPGLMQVPVLSNVLRFLYLTLGLLYSLNFVVGTVNLLPLPLFDGYRVLDVNVGNKLVVKGLMYLTLGAFLLNFLPWLFKP